MSGKNASILVYDPKGHRNYAGIIESQGFDVEYCSNWVKFKHDALYGCKHQAFISPVEMNCKDTIPKSGDLIRLLRISSYISEFQKRRKRLVFVFEEASDDESPTISDFFKRRVPVCDATDFFCSLRDQLRYLTRD